ncbi:MAG: YaiI/YqxD family protein [Deltaproteobacteria bacterium]|nr:YaiI/YqxD family protein [Deltaproteobacteria bacterium]MBW2416477.1 YaiI/YqxD family protein [Deltaproteobacteria bacterium]
MTAKPAPRILVDADACPVKDEVYRVATRYGIHVVLVANLQLNAPPGVETIVVEAGPDAADDWIAENVRPSEIVVTADIPLAARCLDARAHVLGTSGRPFTESSIGDALAGRELSSHLREIGVATVGSRPISQKDRSRFLSKLDELVQRARREAAS